jgi:chromosome partitioning protein
MKLIAVISHKGGAGKTTSAVQLAEELARRGQRTLLVDADRQQGAGLLLGIDAPAGCVQRTRVPQLDYLGSARLTDLEIADCYAGFARRFDVGVVDTPSLDDALARAWLREAAAALMVLQVDPLTVKTLPSALNTLEVVRAFKPSIQILGLLPSMFNPEDEAHTRLLAELLSRRPEAVFTPVVPVDPGLMHRANSEECPPIGESALQAYQCAVDRILRALDQAAPSVALPHAPSAPQPVAAAPRVPAQFHAAPYAAAAAPAGGHPAGTASGREAPAPFAPGPPTLAEASPGQPHGTSAAPAAADPWADPADGALDALATPAEPPRRARQERASAEVPAWWQQATRVDDAGVVRRPESWLVRSRFAIACTVACLALIAAVVLGTLRRAPLANGSSRIPAAVAATPHSGSHETGKKGVGEAHAAGHKPAHKSKSDSGQAGASGKAKGD